MREHKSVQFCSAKYFKVNILDPRNFAFATDMLSRLNLEKLPKDSQTLLATTKFVFSISG